MLCFYQGSNYNIHWEGGAGYDYSRCWLTTVPTLTDVIGVDKILSTPLGTKQINSAAAQTAASTITSNLNQHLSEILSTNIITSMTVGFITERSIRQH